MNSELVIRVGAAVGIFLGLALWEVLSPRRALSLGRARRWPNNLGILVLDAALVRLLIPLAAVGVAVIAAQRGWGLLNITPWPHWLEAIVGFVALDLAIYGQHVAFHKVPILWRLHRMHHADLDIDVSTGVRFHPVEIILSMLIKMGVVILVGVPAIAVVIFEVVLNATSMFNHSNAAMPSWADVVVRLIVVTPDMHRVHHSVLRHETDSNFGFNLPWWDRLFGTYRAQPESGHDRMTVGLPIFRDPHELRLDRLLTQPFRNDTSEAARESQVEGEKAG
ncbi:MAG TPA: sterol desaturase family protein [Xanthobacteraceae bacterium]|nr:sterol desaturase family protein [Xanthobacteraceae bacterium]